MILIRFYPDSSRLAKHDYHPRIMWSVKALADQGELPAKDLFVTHRIAVAENIDIHI